ncbi:hypothetical protein NDU88_006856 [Pleurodeles waltl]|uniref:Uncharacterized protein n=1 Tax=Pleurodeles waltl TaxID=8319 RepID=A0AAV7X2V6_PLEWA|nr:hypothetical protein NDU88_006856 [Pleurodeles waltl]
MSRTIRPNDELLNDSQLLAECFEEYYKGVQKADTRNYLEEITMAWLENKDCFSVEDAVESVKLRGAKLELKAAGQVGWLFLSALCTVYRKTLTQDAEIRKLRDEIAALQERQLLMKETIESAVTRGDQMEARCTALAVRVAKQKCRQKPKIPSAVQVRALVRKENWDPYTWDGTVSDNDDDWNWEDEVKVHVAELGEVEGEKESAGEAHPLVQNNAKGVHGGQIQSSHLVRDYT